MNRVLHVISSAQFAGAERVVVAGAIAQRARGVDVEIANLFDTTPEDLAAAAEKGGVPVVALGPPRERHLPQRLRARVGSNTVVHAHGYAALATMARARPRHAGLFASAHGFSSATFRLRLYEAIERRLLRSVTHVFSVSAALRDRLVDSGVSPSRVTVLQNPLCRPVPAAIPSPRTRLDQLVFVGRLSAEKGVDVLLRALVHLPGLRLDIVGDGPERHRLARQAAVLGLESRVAFAGWVDDVMPHILRADALVLPSLTEGAPLTVVEALALGRPVVATAVGEVPRIVDKKRGVLAAPGDVGALTGAIAELRGGFGAYGHDAFFRRRETAETFSVDTWATHTLDAYAAGRPRPARAA